MAEVTFSGKAAKLPEKIREVLRALVKDIIHQGPVRGNWPHYSKLGSGEHHCHLKAGRPTYVVIWKVIDKNVVKIVYAGTHEKAEY